MAEEIDYGLFTPRIAVVGVGGQGSNLVNRLFSSGIKSADTIAINTDLAHLNIINANKKLLIGKDITNGLGAGGYPEVAEKCADASRAEIESAIQGYDLVFVAAGMGGGTGTGSAGVVARIARELGALTVAVVTKPFIFEGNRRMKQAEEGLRELRNTVDTVITIPNQRLLAVAGKNTSMIDAFKKVDEVLLQAVKGISDLINVHGLINVDFADVKTIMSEMGMALMGTGIAQGENRALEAAQKAVSSPLLEDIKIEGARGLLINIAGGKDMGIAEVSEAAEKIKSEAHPDANIIFGAVIDDELEDKMMITVIATGLGGEVKPVSLVSVQGGAAGSQQTTTTQGLNQQIKQSFTEEDQNATPLKSIPDNVVKIKDKPSYAEKFSDMEEEVNYEDDQWDIPTFMRKQAD